MTENMFGFFYLRKTHPIFCLIFLSCFGFVSYIGSPHPILILCVMGGKIFIWYSIFFTPENSKSRAQSIISALISAYFPLF